MVGRRGEESKGEGGNSVEQITRREDAIYYGEHKCLNADDAYRRFRNDYHKSLGTRAYHRLNRLGSRKERIIDTGFHFAIRRENPLGDTKPIRVRLMGMVGPAYCKSLGIWDIPFNMDEDTYFAWVDWAFQRGSGGVRLYSERGKGRMRLKTKRR